MRRTLAFLLMLGTSACYTYTPLAASGLQTSTDVQLALSDAGSVQLSPLIGPQVESLEGRVTSLGDTVVVLRVRSTTNRRGEQTIWNGESVTVPKGTVASVRGKTLSKRRTWLVGAAALAGVILAGEAFGLGGGLDGLFGGRGGGTRQ